MQKEESFPLKKKIAIIGGGISGLASAKYALANGYTPTLFEKRSDIGGIWSPTTGYTWNSLICNSSKYMGQFADHEIPATVSMFPTTKEIVEYLNSYVTKFDLSHYIQLNSEVTYVGFRKTQENEEIWKVEWFDSKAKEAKSEEFGALIVATGFYNLPNLDYFQKFIDDESNNKIKFMHSLEYKENSIFRDKEVVLVGCSYSSQQIAVEIAEVSKNLYNVFRKPSWALNRTLFNSFFEKKLPLDFTFFNVKTTLPKKDEPILSKAERNAKINSMFSKFCKQGHIPELDIGENSQNNPVISVSDNYVESIDKGLIKPIKSGIKNIQNNRVTLDNGTNLEPDLILLSTGFKSLIPNLDKSVLEELNFEKNDELCPLSLYNTTFNPKYKTLAFVGVYKGLFLGSADLQAKYALNYLTGNSKVSSEKIEENLKEQMQLRNLEVKPQYANGGYVNFLNIMAKEMGMMPDLEKIEREDPNFYNFIINIVASPVLYYMNDEDPKKRSEAFRLLDEMKKALNL